MTGKRLAGTGGIALLVGVAAYGHVLYPLWLALTTRNTPDDDAPPDPRSWPPLTVIIPAYREEGLIAAKVEDVLRNGYPGPLEVIVVADDRGTAAAARATEARVLALERRMGKAAALNHAIARSSNDLVVITDANTHFAPDALSALVRRFADDSVGAVAGEKRIRGARGESLYWRFESWLKRREARTGTTIGMVGELAALRRRSIKEIPADVPIDDLWLALDIVEAGGRIAYEPRAYTEEDPTGSLGLDWDRRTRIVAGTLEVLSRRRRLLVPGTSRVTAQLWGHRLVRSSAGPLAHALLVLIALSASGRSPIARLFIAGHTAAAGALLRRESGANVTRLEQMAAQTLYLQAVGFGGTIRYLLGDRPAIWPKVAR